MRVRNHMNANQVLESEYRNRFSEGYKLIRIAKLID